MLISKIVKIKWSSNNKNYYIEKGYTFTKIRDEFEVKVEDLKSTSCVTIECICDYCGEPMKRYYSTYLKGREVVPKDCCNKCISKKSKETCMKKYGVENTTKLDWVQEKIKKTCLERYGVENALQNEEIKQKIKNTNLERYGTVCSLNCEEIKNKAKQTCLKKYGTEHPLQNEEIKQKVKNTNLERYGTTCTLNYEETKNKSKQTCLEKYGVANYCESDDFKNKFKQTSLEKYGVEHPFQSEEVKEKIKESFEDRYGVPHNMKSKEGYEAHKKAIFEKYGVDNVSKIDSVKEKIRKSLHDNGTAPKSRNQVYICNLVNGDLNHNVGYFSLDIALDNNIYIEYDGSGHDLRVKKGSITEKQFKKEEVSRKLYLQNLGWKLIRIISKRDKMLEDSLLLSLIDEAKNYLLTTSHTWVEIDIDDRSFKCKEYKKNF